MPKPTNGGKTYTFHIKPGIKFSPPVNRAGHLGGLRHALERLANPKDGAEYAFYYYMIKGLTPTSRQGEDDLGHLDPELVDDRLQPHAADRRLPLGAGDARSGPDAG